LPNINAALGLAQIECIDAFLAEKKVVAKAYCDFFKDRSIQLFTSREECSPNNWLNAIILKDLKERNEFLDYTNNKGIMTRPIWRLMHRLDMFKHSQVENVENAEWLEDRIVNIPSSVRINK